MHHFHVDHNVCITIVFDFPQDDCSTQEKLETIVMHFFSLGGGGGEGKQGALWSM